MTGPCAYSAVMIMTDFYDVWAANREGIDQARGYLLRMTPHATTFEDSRRREISTGPAHLAIWTWLNQVP